MVQVGCKRGSFYALQAAEHKRRQKVTDAVKGRSKTPGFQKASGWLSSARPLWLVCSSSHASHISCINSCEGMGLPLSLGGENNTQ